MAHSNFRYNLISRATVREESADILIKLPIESCCILIFPRFRVVLLDELEIPLKRVSNLRDGKFLISFIIWVCQDLLNFVV